MADLDGENNLNPSEKDNEKQRLSPRDIEAPPNAESRNFNENDILGDFDTDEKGKMVLLEDD